MYILFWDDWDSWVKVLSYGVMGKNVNFIPPYVQKVFKSTPSVLNYFITSRSIIDCKVCKSSSVRGKCIALTMYYFGW